MSDEYPEVVSQDRSAICDIISEMLDEPSDGGIYRTTRAYNKMEALLQAARAQAAGWTWAEACTQLDRGDDPRQYEIPHLLSRIEHDLNQPAQLLHS